MPKKKFDYEKIARVYVSNGCKNIGEAMQSGGYSEATAKRGRAALTPSAKKRIEAEMARLDEGKSELRAHVELQTAENERRL